jgi:adenylate kinase family enzyme
MIKYRRIHIMGASGAGVTSLGRALADALAIPHHDTDDYSGSRQFRRIRKSARSPIACG